MGLSSSASIVLIQEIVDWSERGSVTASYLFARTLGSTFGATVFGAVLNMGLMRSGLGAVTSDELRRLLEGGAAANAALKERARSLAPRHLRLDVRRRRCWSR